MNTRDGYLEAGNARHLKEAIPSMSYCKNRWIWIFVLLVFLLLPGKGLASPRFVSGTPLIPPVAAQGPVATPVSAKTALSLLGNAQGLLPLQEKFYVTLFNGSGMRQVTADLRYPLGNDPKGRLNIYVESGVPVDSGVIESLARQFEETIHPVINQYFGTESDIDENNQVTLLITRLDADHISGYFDSRNQYSNQWIANSNEREMIYINSLVLGFGLDTVLQTLAHEFTHLVQWNYNWNYSPDNIWFAEGMAMYGSYLVGKVSGQKDYWDFGTIQAFLRSYSSISLVDWQQRYEDYGAAYAYMVYLSEHYSPGHLRRLFQDPRTDRLDVLAEYLAGYDTNLDEVLVDWAVANAFDLADSHYGYSDIAMGLKTSSLPKLSGSSFTLPPWVGRYWQLDSSNKQGQVIRLKGQPGLAARLVEKQADGKVRVGRFEGAGGDLSYVREPGMDVTEVILVATNTEATQQVSVSLEVLISPTDNIKAAVLPDLLLPGRYTVLVKAEAGLDGPPIVEVSGIRGEKKLDLAQMWAAKGMYLTEPFASRATGQGPVLLEVKAYKSGKETRMRQTLQLE